MFPFSCKNGHIFVANSGAYIAPAMRNGLFMTENCYHGHKYLTNPILIKVFHVEIDYWIDGVCIYDFAVPIIYEVCRIRDGKSFATRRVDAIQKGNVIFTMLASFQVGHLPG